MNLKPGDFKYEGADGVPMSFAKELQIILTTRTSSNKTRVNAFWGNLSYEYGAEYTKKAVIKSN